MGTSITSRYQLVMSGGGFIWTPQCWFTKDRPAYGIRKDGPANAVGLYEYMERFLDSMKPGGANEHLGGKGPTAARLLDSETGKTIARWSRPEEEVS